jgi:Tol biopolymer transport system component
MFDFNAYEPVPSPDGKLIAYVLTGRKVEALAGFGRSHLRSDVRFCDSSGQPLLTPDTEGFLGEWLPNSSNVVRYRDWKFGLVSLSGSRESDSMFRGRDQKALLEKRENAERVAYLSKLRTFVWLEYTDTGTVLQTPDGPIAEFKDQYIRISAVAVPSPDGRYLAMGEVDAGHSLWMYDTVEKKLANLGKVTIHVDPGWDYNKPGWNPWFADGKHLAFFSGASLYVASPDGKNRRELLKEDHGGLAIPSPDGRLIAYATFSPRPVKGRKDLEFWGGSSLWIVPTGGGAPTQVTNPSEEETYDLRWLTQESLIFDRIGEGMFNGHARIWTVPIGNQ